jgi:hypothetical protein
MAFAALLFVPSLAQAQTTWRRDLDNPVIPGIGGGGYAFRPSVVWDSDHFAYRMWLTSKFYGGRWSIYHAISFDGTSWFASFSDPVLEGGDKYFESEGVTNCAVIHDAAEYKMYYAGVHGCCALAIGLATSDDGIHWTKSPNNPVIVPSAAGWDSGYVSAPQVDYDGATYRMYYEGGNAGETNVGLARSTDGVIWTKSASNPVIRHGVTGSWNESSVSPGGVYKDHGVFHMLLTGRATPSDPQTIGLVSAPDDSSWTDFDQNPVMTGGGIAAWDWTITAGSAVMLGDSLQLWYSGNGATGVNWSTGHAVSTMTLVRTPPTLMALPHNSPNPFKGVTTVSFDVPERAPVSVRVFDVAGRVVATLVQQTMDPGTHSVTFKAPLGPGLYLCTLRVGDRVRSRKMVALP